MKKYKYISLSVILILIVTLIIALFKPIIIADMLYKFNANDLALKMYQRQYDKTTDTRSLKGINLSWHESKNRSKDSEWAEYALQVLEQEEYYTQTDKEFLDKIRTRYLNYVYFSGDIDDFIKKYHEHIEKIEDNIFFKLSFVLQI